MNEKFNRLIEKLRKHPDLFDRIEAILDIVSNSSGKFEKASETEFQVITEMRNLGKNVLHEWAANQAAVKSNQFVENNKGATKHSKKNFIGTPHTEK